MRASNSCLIRSRIANVTYSINRICPTSRKIGPSSHQVLSDFWFPVRYYPSFFPLDSFCVTVLESTKTLHKKYHCPRSVLAFVISFQIRFVEFVSVVESCCWFNVFVVVVQSPVAVCLFLPLSHPPLPKQQVDPPHYSTCLR